MRFTFCFSRNCNPYPTIFALRSWPCWPGEKFLFSMPQDGLKHLSPFRNSFIPSLRHSLHTGPIYLAKLNSPSLRRTTTVVRNWSDVTNCANFQTCGLQGSDRRIATGTGSLHIDLKGTHSRFTRAVRSRNRGLLRGEWRPFAGPLEPQGAGAGPAHDITFEIRYGNGRIVERCLNV